MMNCLPVTLSTPKMLEWFDQTNFKCHVCIFERQETIYFVYRSLYLFRRPKNLLLLISYLWYLNIINYAEN